MVRGLHQGLSTSLSTPAPLTVTVRTREQGKAGCRAWESTVRDKGPGKVAREAWLWSKDSDGVREPGMAPTLPPAGLGQAL